MKIFETSDRITKFLARVLLVTTGLSFFYNTFIKPSIADNDREMLDYNDIPPAPAFNTAPMITVRKHQPLTLSAPSKDTFRMPRASSCCVNHYPFK